MYGCKAVATPLVTNEKYKKEDGSNEANASKYKSLIRSLLHLTATRPDIMYPTSLLSKFMQTPSQEHYGAAKRVLRYLQGIMDFGICKNKTIEIEMSISSKNNAMPNGLTEESMVSKGSKEKKMHFEHQATICKDLKIKYGDEED
ncbi:hypothetical protein LIER_06885 [Lithospermum erythrorhizon]|uniref:Uncharacterized protein n=1 Tax=Lithospermum erythrorhizon TaxID=34254 RepID=A0AAV3P7Z4_LITER